LVESIGAYLDTHYQRRKPASTRAIAAKFGGVTFELMDSLARHELHPYATQGPKETVKRYGKEFAIRRWQWHPAMSDRQPIPLEPRASRVADLEARVAALTAQIAELKARETP
jgi:hypothetical protein